MLAKIRAIEKWIVYTSERFFWVRLDMWQVFYLPLAIQGTLCRRQIVWQTTRDCSWSNPELFPHQDNTDPSLLSILSSNKVRHHMACTPWWVRVNLRDAKQRKKRINPMSRLLTAYKKKKRFRWFFSWSSLAYTKDSFFGIYPYRNLFSKICHRLKGKAG